MSITSKILKKGQIGILSTVTGIDAKTTGTTTLYTPSGNSVVPISFIFRVTSASGVTVNPTLGVGVNGAADDLMPSDILSFVLTTAGQFGTYYINSSFSFPTAIVPSGTAIKLGIDTGATATSLILTIDVIGYLI